MNTAASHDNLPQEVRLLRQKLEVIDAKLDTITFQNQHLNDSLIGVDDAAKLLGITRGAIYSKVYRHLIPYYKSGGKLYFSKQEILQEIFSHRYPKNGSHGSVPQPSMNGSKAVFDTRIKI
ncbi:helix-turn-helix domain-containing protein [Chlorobaculum limnaeum]|nr:helix-turn-helix domain-containing protein [Chlorobaculum limnaeum]